MDKTEVAKVKCGVAKLFWKSGGYSLASIGMTTDGTKWFAAANWVGVDGNGILSTDWRQVQKVEMFMTCQEVWNSIIKRY